MSVPVDNLLSSASRKRALIAGSVGNFIEWYEFAVYGFLATVIAQNFFRLEGESALTGLLLTYASFAIDHDQHKYQRGFAPDAITHPAENDCTEWTEEKGDGE